jgi:hypothetical protein
MTGFLVLAVAAGLGLLFLGNGGSRKDDDDEIVHVAVDFTPSSRIRQVITDVYVDDVPIIHDATHNSPMRQRIIVHRGANVKVVTEQEEEGVLTCSITRETRAPVGRSREGFGSIRCVS